MGAGLPGGTPVLGPPPLPALALPLGPGLQLLHANDSPRKSTRAGLGTPVLTGHRYQEPPAAGPGEPEPSAAPWPLLCSGFWLILHLLTPSSRSAPVSHPRLLPLLPCSPPKVATSGPPLHSATTLPSPDPPQPSPSQGPATGLPASSHGHPQPSGS